MSCLARHKVDIPALPDFNAARYMGSWYEIARLNHPFEKGLERVSACYTLRPDGKITVVNRGFAPDPGRWKEAKAIAVQTPVKNFLKVYFVPLFGGRYRVAYVDDDYTLAVVSGGNLRYLWLMARSAHPTPVQIESMLDVARRLGYDTSKLIYPAQE